MFQELLPTLGAKLMFIGVCLIVLGRILHHVARRVNKNSKEVANEGYDDGIHNRRPKSYRNSSHQSYYFECYAKGLEKRNNDFLKSQST